MQISLIHSFIHISLTIELMCSKRVLNVCLYANNTSSALSYNCLFSSQLILLNLFNINFSKKSVKTYPSESWTCECEELEPLDLITEAADLQEAEHALLGQTVVLPLLFQFCQGHHLLRTQLYGQCQNNQRMLQLTYMSILRKHTTLSNQLDACGQFYGNRITNQRFWALI